LSGRRFTIRGAEYCCDHSSPVLVNMVVPNTSGVSSVVESGTSFEPVQFITTVSHAPTLLILDEPASGLDPVNQEVLRDTILGARDEGRTVVFSTHNMDQAGQLCDAVCIIAEGQSAGRPAARDPPHACRDPLPSGVRIHDPARQRAAVGR
jgi:energy-coupling factor transporter ATP-binding protein EcfA2